MIAIWIFDWLLGLAGMVGITRQITVFDWALAEMRGESDSNDKKPRLDLPADLTLEVK